LRALRALRLCGSAALREAEFELGSETFISVHPPSAIQNKGTKLIVG